MDLETTKQNYAVATRLAPTARSEAAIAEPLAERIGDGEKLA